MTSSQQRKHFLAGTPKSRAYFKTYCPQCKRVTEHQRTFSTFDQVNGQPVITRCGPCLACAYNGRNTWNEQHRPISQKKGKEEHQGGRKEAVLA